MRNSQNALHIVPVSLREANEFLAKYSRQYRPMRGCKFSVGCAVDERLVGAVIAGRVREDAQALQIDRIYTTGGRAAYGMLYGAAARAAQALGYWRVIAFLPEGKPDSALRAAGWQPIEPVDGGKRAHTLCYERRLMVRRRWKEMKP